MGRKILVVDDGRTEQLMLAKLLGAEYTVVEAMSGEAALSALRRDGTSISAVLLDIVMPGMDGFEVLKHIKANALWRTIPVIVTTGITEEDAQIRALELGANAFAIKPIHPTLLLQTLRNTIRLCETAAIANAASRDRLTGLFNREAFFIQAEKLIRRQQPGYYILSCVDIDSFKVINDQHGTKTGDEVLRHVASCLGDMVGAWDGIACRFMADRFAVLYPASCRDSDTILENHERVTQPPCLERRIHIRVGHYLVDDPSLPVSAMYDRATLAEESCKGRYGVYIADYQESMRERLLDEQGIVSSMHAALKGGQFEPWLQPQYNHATGALVGAEALARWRHPQRGLIPPAEFVPIFERNGFVYELDKYIWEQVCCLLRRWLDEGADPLPVSVNISRCDVLNDDFLPVLTGLVEKYRIPVELFRLEITESAFSEASGQVVSVVRSLIERGYTVEIDDFGSGYSSLNTLKDVPAQILKLDMRFFEKTGDSQRSGNIVESVVRMAKWIGMTVIAEGVETEAQADFLKSIGCFYVQGYYYARPMPVEEYEALARGGVRQHRLNGLDTLENFDNSAFWNADSLDTMVFSHFSGGAFIFEYNKGRVELLRVNDEFAKTLRSPLTNAEILKMEPMSTLDADARQKIAAAMKRAMDSGRAESCEVYTTQYCAPGGGEYVRVTMRRIAACGERILFYGYVDNITAQREAERKERETASRIAAVMDNATCGITAVILHEDSTAEYLLVNDRYYDLVGYTREQYAAEQLRGLELMHPDDLREYQKQIVGLNTVGQTLSFEFRAKREGNWIWLRDDITVIRLVGIDRPVQLSCFTDITARRETEERLRFVNELAGDILSETDNGRAVDDTLRRLLAYCGAERCYIVELDYKRWLTSNTYEVCAEGVLSEKENLQNVPFGADDFWYSELVQRRFFKLDDVDALPDRESGLRELLRAQGIRSMVLAPLWRDGRLIGFVGLDNPTMVPKELARMSAPADYLAVLLTRRDLEAKIREANAAQLELLDNLPCGAALYEYDGRELRVKHLNRRYWELVRRAHMEYDDVSFIGAVFPDDRPLIARELAAAIREERDFRADLRILCGETEYRPFRVAGRLTRQADGTYLIYAAYTPLAESEAAFELQTLLHVIPSGVLKYSADQRQEIAYINRNFMEGLGYTEQQFREKFHNCFRELVYREDRERAQREIDRQEGGGGIGRFDYRVEAADGTLHWFHDEGVKVRDEAGKEWYFVSLSDVTERRKAEEILRQSEEEFRLATRLSGNVICRYDVAESAVTVAPDVAKRFSLPERVEDVPYGRVRLGKISPDTADEYLAFYESLLHGEKEGVATFKKQLYDGWHWLTAHFAAVSDESGKPVSAVISYADVTEQMEIRERAETDPLTGLLNRSAFLDSLSRLLAAGADGELNALLMLDLDGFKQVNDTYGHAAGDQALTEVAQRLRAAVRSDDLVCRLGGDEFMAFLRRVPSREAVATKAARLCEAFTPQFSSGVRLSVSIGIALHPADGADFETLYEKADAALYRQKKAGKNGFSFAKDDA